MADIVDLQRRMKERQAEEQRLHLTKDAPDYGRDHSRRPSRS